MQSHLHRRGLSTDSLANGLIRWLTYLCLTLAVITPHRVAADPDHEVDTEEWVKVNPTTIDGLVPTPWQCFTPDPGPGMQSMIQFHQNWHCTNTNSFDPGWGRRFFGFHRQFVFGYNRFLSSRNQAWVKTWVPAPGKQIPPGHKSLDPQQPGRAKNTPCIACQILPEAYKLPLLVNRFKTIDSLGMDINGWHGANHMAISRSGGEKTCNAGGEFVADMGCTATAARDAIFYQYHNIFDDIQDAWRTFQPTDIAIVLDRSGSMSMPSVSNTGASRLDDAKEAAFLFANLLEDGSSHQLGMISFSTTATPASSPDMPLTSVLDAPATLSAALTGINAGGLTNIGDGLQQAQTLLNPDDQRRKAILLLTDGEENRTPNMLDVDLGDTHVCSIGFGIRGISSGKLQPLSERQGGIYLTGDKTIELKKFFVFCFANIFDAPVAEDPIDTLPAGRLISSPTIHRAFLDEKVVFVLGWTNSSPPGTLQLAITTPSGNVVDLDAPGVESKFGPTWHIVRFKLPFNGEGDGNWTARAIRPIRTYVNGFSSRAFADFEQGVTLVQNELATLCASGCHNILYFEDTTNHTESADFTDRRSIYASALFSQPTLTNITRPDGALAFRDALQGGYGGEGGFDLVVYSSQYTRDEQPYDESLARILCMNGTRAIVSDNRHTEGARDILRCAGAQRGNRTNFETLVPADSRLLDHPAQLRSQANVRDFSYELFLTNGTAPQVISTTGAIAVVVQGQAAGDEEFFITVLARSTVKVKPSKNRNNTYTLEDLHPTFHIPSAYWPTCGFDKVYATVNVTRPLDSLSKLLASIGATNGSTLHGETVSPRATAAQILAEKGAVIRTETKQYKLYDDGTHGDSAADDHYWEVGLPPDCTAVDGDYDLHAFFRLCKVERCGRESCVEREAHQIITVRAQMHPKSKVIVKKLAAHDGNHRALILITPVDKKGNLLGPGLLDELLITPIGGVRIEEKSDLDGRGKYQITVDWVKKDRGGERPGLTIAQFGRPQNAIHVKL